MKRQMTALLLALAIALSLTGCGAEQPGSTEPTNALAPTAETEQAESSQQTQSPSVFEETVLIDDEHCTMIIREIIDDPLWGYTLKAYLDNRTDRELMFTLDRVSVNGFMCDPMWAASITPGMKANESIRFLTSDFRQNGIETPTEIRFTLRIYDAGDYTAPYLVDQEFSLYPLGEEAVEQYSRTPSSEDIVLFDNEYAAMIITGFHPDGVWGYEMSVYLENKTDKALMFSADDVAVNGFLCDPYWSVEVAPGMRSNTTISWFTETFVENGITQVESILLPITVSDADNWLADDLIHESFTVNP